MWKIGVIGLGPAGCLFLASLPRELLRHVVVFDSGGVGGDLGRLWGNVVANLTRGELAKAFHNIPQWKDVVLDVLEKWDPEACPLLSDVAMQLRELMKPILKEVVLHSLHVNSVHQDLVGWRLVVAGSEFLVNKLVICTGGEATLLDYPKPAIPLEIALDRRALASYIRPSDRIVVFGTAHSGTLIMRNLRDVGCKEIVGVYRGAVPFRWARRHTPECPCVALGGTGCHDSEGVKQESAAIADAIVRGEWPEVRIMRGEGAEFVRAVMEADYVVYATGFRSRVPLMYGIGGRIIGDQHDPKTGLLAPGAWGFGLAFPATYEKPQGGEAPDIGLPGFVGHILACLPAILEDSA